MPGTYAVDYAATFTSAILVNCMPKLVFGTKTQQQETNAQGIPKWQLDVAVTYTPTTPGMPAQSELISVTITDGAHPAQGLNPGTPVAFDGLRVGLNPPEVRDGKLRGGKLWHTAMGVRSLVVSQPGPRRGDAAA